MKKNLSLVITLVIFLIAVFAFMEITTERKIMKLVEKTEEDIVRVDLFIYKSYLKQIANDVFKKLGKETLSFHDFERISRSLKDESTVYIIWTDVDGNVLYKLGNLYPEEDIYEDNLYQAVLYSEEGTLIADIYPLKEGVQIRCAGIFSTKEGEEVVLVVGKKMKEEFLKDIENVARRDVTMFFGTKQVYKSSTFSRDISELLKLAETSQEPVSKIFKGDFVVSVVPIFDFDEWEIKGFLVNKLSWESLSEKLNHLRKYSISLFILSIVVLLVGILLVSKKKRTLSKRSIKTIVYLSLAPAILSVFFIIFFTATHILQNLDEEALYIVANAIDEYLKTWEISENTLEELKKTFNMYFSFETSKGVSMSTVPPNLLKKMEEITISLQRGNIQFGDVKMNRVPYEAVLVNIDGGKILALKEKTPVINTILSLRFISYILWSILLLIGAITGFVVLNVERPRLLRSTLVGYTFLAPALIHLIWWAVGPVAFSFFLAFHRWNVIDPAKPFVGFDNFKELFQDKLFWNAMKNTAIFSLQVPISMLLSLLVALGVNKRVRGIRLLRTIYYLPAVTAGVSTTVVWRWILNKEYGILNYVLGFFGVPKIPWLTSPRTALIAIMLMSIWQSLGSQMVIFLAGLQSIPRDFYDAASVDGANAFQRFRHITLPLLKPTTLFVLVTSIIGSFQIFTPVYVLTQGGPLRSTDVVFYHIWESAWVELRMGYAAAQSWMLFAVLLILTLIEFRLFGKESWQYYF